MKRYFMLAMLLVLTGCDSSKKELAYFQAHPDKVQEAANDCISKAQYHKNVLDDALCKGIILYGQAQCQQPGSVFQMMDCKNSAQILWKMRGKW